MNFFVRAFTQRFLAFASLVAPSVVLALMPKCPVCLAGYLAIATGVGVSVATAANLRMGVMILCVSCFLFLTVKHIRRVVGQTET